MPEYLSNIKYAERVGISKVSIGKAVKLGRIVKTPRGIDPEHPSNKYYVTCALENQALGKAQSLKKVGKPKRARPVATARSKPKEKKEIASAVEEAVADNSGFEIDLDDIEGSLDGLLPKAKADLRKILEQVKLLILKREEKRKELIPRKMVRDILSKLYIIENNEFKPLGTRCAPDIAAICGIDDPAKILKVDERIEAEVYKILKHMKIEIDKFLRKQETDEIEGVA